MLIDINDLDRAEGHQVEGDEIVVGAMVRHAEILDSAILSEHYAIFREAEKVIADPIVRNRGTVGGSLCQADPAEDLSAVGAHCAARSSSAGPGARGPCRSGSSTRGPTRPKVGPAEILTEVRIPIRPGAGSAYEKVERRVGDWAGRLGGAYVVVNGGVVTDCGIGLAAVGAEHCCAPEAEAYLIGKEPSEENLDAAAGWPVTPAGRAPTSAVRSTTRSTSPTNSPCRALRRAARASQGA